MLGEFLYIVADGVRTASKGRVNQYTGDGVLALVGAPFHGQTFSAGPYEIDILACPDCGNRLRLVATIELIRAELNRCAVGLLARDGDLSVDTNDLPALIERLFGG